jgi:hypothetical protein
VEDYRIPPSFPVVKYKSIDDVSKYEVLMALRSDDFMSSFVCIEHEVEVVHVRDSDL